jgi:hypothetical protein
MLYLITLVCTIVSKEDIAYSHKKAFRVYQLLKSGKLVIYILDTIHIKIFFIKMYNFSVHKRFSQLDLDAVRRDKNAKLPMRLILQLPELHVRE